MNPTSLIAPASAAPYPTPFWFIELFKVLGFSLHMVPMHMWYAGTIIAVVLGISARGEGKTLGRHIARALPFALAFGVNFGIIPLLFIQVAYYQFFYPATILIAWPWFAVFWMVTTAYFAIYLYRLALYGKGPVRIGMAVGWIGAGIFLVVGFLFANAMSLMTRADGWWDIFKGAQIGGAATGLALNTGDPTLIPRWLFMFGLAMTTTAVFVVVDAAFMSDKDGESYRRYSGRFATVLYTVGALWFAGFGSWYIFGTRMWGWNAAMANPLMKIIFPLTAVAPAIPWLLILLQRKGPTRRLAATTGVAQFAVVALNAVSRQWLQNVEVGRYADIAGHPVSVQTSALIVFLLIFVGGIGLVTWMLSKVIEVNRMEARKSRATAE